MSRTGVLTPVLECTQVTATRRVSGRMAFAMAAVIASAVACSGRSYIGTRRTVALLLPGAPLKTLPDDHVIERTFFLLRGPAGCADVPEPLEGATPSGGPASPPPVESEESGAVMTLVEHLEELRRRLIIVMIAVAVCTAGAFVFWDPIFGFLLTPLPSISGNPELIQHGKLVISDPVGSFMVALKVSVAVGISVASPILLYQLWGFLAPGLTRKERKYAGPFTFLGVALFVVGLVVGFVTLRYPMDWLLNFGSDRFIPLITADSYFTFVTYFLLAFGIVFELPLVITFLGLAGIVNSRILRQKRLYILFALWFVSAFITPGADPVSPVIIGVAFTALFELSILLLRAIKR